MWTWILFAFLALAFYLGVVGAVRAALDHWNPWDLDEVDRTGFSWTWPLAIPLVPATLLAYGVFLALTRAARLSRDGTARMLERWGEYRAQRALPEAHVVTPQERLTKAVEYREEQQADAEDMMVFARSPERVRPL